MATRSRSKKAAPASAPEKKASGVPAPTRENAPLNMEDPAAVQKYRESAHKAAEADRALGTGAEPQSFNKNATK